MSEPRLPLPDALIEWSPPDAIKAIRNAELSAGNLTLRTKARFTLDSIRTTRTVPFNWQFSSGGLVGIPHLNVAWESLIGRFKLEIEREKICVEGTEDFITRNRSIILPDQAAEIVVDPPSGAIFIGMRTYKGVVAFRPPLLEGGIQVRTPDPNASDPSVTDVLVALEKDIEAVPAIDVTTLHPDVVVALLEKHAEHVRVGLRVSLALPGKVSCIALIASMMKHRNQRGELRASLAEEAGWLAKWAQSAAPSYFCPGEKAIANKLRPLYNDLTKGSPFPPQ